MKPRTLRVFTSVLLLLYVTFVDAHTVNNIKPGAGDVTADWYSQALKNIKLYEEKFYASSNHPFSVSTLNKTPEWSTSADGLLTNLINTQINSALYGYTVTGLGDVNGDGYGDVAISAPGLADIFSGSGSLASVGAVFVFYGSASGLSATPAKTLQPSTAVAGALFGLSVDAGDVNGDGINDIIVGAPLDSYQTTATGLLGPVSVNVKAGKVYVYPGGNLAASNPSNFIEIKLQGTNFFSTGVLGLLNNVSVNALFGFSVAATNDLDGDNKADLIIGSPAYSGTSLTAVQNGASFVYSSKNLTTSSPVQLQTPSSSLLGLVSFPSLTGSGLLFGFSVDGVGDYNNDGYPDVVVGAPAGIDLSSLSGIFTGQVLSGSAYIYYGNGSGVNSTIGAMLKPSAGSLLSNAANLFGYKVKGIRNTTGSRNGNIVVGAPLAGLLPNALGLSIQTGNVHVFKKKISSPSGAVTSDQVLESPRSSGLLQILNTLNVNVLFGAAIDNAYDVNCDGYPDLVVGEPLSSRATLAQLQANALGGSVYVYISTSTGDYVSTPQSTISSSTGNEFLSVNAVSLFGYSVAGAPYTRGITSTPRILAGAPAGALDFSSGLLNLGNTLSVLFNFTAGNNGPGKAFLFDLKLCSAAAPLPITLLTFKGEEKTAGIDLYWKAGEENDLDHYELERSSNGGPYETVALVLPWEDKSRSDYSYSDKSVTPGVNYYRLKMVEKSRVYTYSQILTFSISESIREKIFVTPNPVVSNIIRVQFNNVSDNSYYNIQLRNASGTLFIEQSVHVTRYGQIQCLMRTASMTPGIYFITFFEKNNKKVSCKKIIML